MIKGLTFPFFGKKIKNMAKTTIPITTVTVLLLIAIMLTGTTTNVVSVWAGTFPGPNEQIAFSSFRDSNEESDNEEIYIMNADGSGQTRLTDDPAIDRFASWSPDGEKIAFSSNRDSDNDEIYVMNADDGSDVTRLTDNDANNLSPSWSPNGERIAFSSNGEENATR